MARVRAAVFGFFIKITGVCVREVYVLVVKSIGAHCWCGERFPVWIFKGEDFATRIIFGKRKLPDAGGRDGRIMPHSNDSKIGNTVFGPVPQ